MKRFLTFAICFCLALLPVFAGAEEYPGFNSNLMDDAKSVLKKFDAGDYSGAADILGCADASELEKFVTGNFSQFGGGVQTTYAVAYCASGGSWKVAVPLSEPSSDNVETLVLITDDTGSAFTGYRYATWGSVTQDSAGCDYVLWDEEYVSDSEMVIYSDD